MDDTVLPGSRRVEWSIILWINARRFLAGQAVKASARGIWMTLNWLPPGLLEPGQEYRAELRIDRNASLECRVRVRHASAEGIGLEIVGAPVRKQRSERMFRPVS